MMKDRTMWTPRMRRSLCRGLAVLLCCSATLPWLAAADTTQNIPLWDLIAAGSWIGVLIILASIVCVTLAIEQILGLSRERKLMQTIGDSLTGQELGGHEAEVLQWCSGNKSLVASLLQAGLHANADHREQAVQDEAADYAGNLYRKAEYMLFIGNTAPMLGLLGTVVGMMQSFNVIAIGGGSADPGQLADGISKALVTTCMGLLVALPALAIYTATRNRIDRLVGDVGKVVERVLFPERLNQQMLQLAAQAQAQATAQQEAAQAAEGEA